MDNWFTVEEIDRDTYAISEYRHWEETHCYLLCGEQRAVLIDTGLGVSNIREVVESLTALPVTVLTTHVHWDHIGGHRYFETTAVHEAETDWLSGRFPLPLPVVKQNLMAGPCDFPPDFSLDEYEIFQGVPAQILRDGAQIHFGDRTLNVIHTPGHSPGHCCFYEPDRKYLFSGDLIYNGCLDAFYPTTDPAAFYRPVRKVQSLEISRLFPGHHALDVSPGIVSRISGAFAGLSSGGLLHQGAGMFDFGDFQIHI